MEELFRCTSCGLILKTNLGFAFDCSCGSRGKFARVSSMDEFYNWSMRTDVCEFRGGHVSNSLKKFSHDIGDGKRVVMKACSGCQEEFICSGSDWALVVEQ